MIIGESNLETARNLVAKLGGVELLALSPRTRQARSTAFPHTATALPHTATALPHTATVSLGRA